MAATDDEFEAQLRRDLPRGLERRAQAVGRDRGLLARWLQPDEMVGDEWQAEAGLLLGRRKGRVIGWKDDRHMLTIAGSRAGKGVSLIIPNLIHYTGSAVVIDPKGENAARTARHRGGGADGGKKGLGQIVHVLDPYGESGLDETSSFNPLDALILTSPTVIDDAGLFAEALIIHPEHGERHWTEAAQAVIRAIILMVVADPMFADRRNLVTVRRLLTLSDKAIEKVLENESERRKDESERAHRQRKRGAGQAAEDDDDEEGDRQARQMKAENALIKLLLDQPDHPFGFVCNGVGEQLEAMAAKERGSVLSSARTQTQWLDSPQMHAVLVNRDEANKLDLADVKRKAMTIYLCLPATRMTTHARWLRLIVLLAIGVMERVKEKPPLPVLFLLDEFAVLGHMQSIETAAGLMAGFGVKLWPIVQNIGQLKKHYPTSWETFIANAGCITAFGVSDSESLKVLSEFVGNTGMVMQVDSGASRSAQLQGASPLREHRDQVPLLAGHELRLVFGRRKQRALVFNVESDPAVVQRFVYYANEGPDHDEFGGKYDSDPNYGPRR